MRRNRPRTASIVAVLSVLLVASAWGSGLALADAGDARQREEVVPGHGILNLHVGAMSRGETPQGGFVEVERSQTGEIVGWQLLLEGLRTTLACEGEAAEEGTGQAYVGPSASPAVLYEGECELVDYHPAGDRVSGSVEVELDRHHLVCDANPVCGGLDERLVQGTTVKVDGWAVTQAG